MGTIDKGKEWYARPLQDETVSGNFPRCCQRAEKTKNDVQSWIIPEIWICTWGSLVKRLKSDNNSTSLIKAKDILRDENSKSSF